MSDLGTLTWAARTHGKLSRREKMGYLLQLVTARLSLILRKQGVDPQRQARIDPNRLVMPDSKLARDAEEHCRALSSDDLIGHCIRAYLWGGMLAQYDGVKPDPEQHYVAAMLHDLGLTETHGADPRFHCFAVEGTMAADAFLRSANAPTQVRENITESICVHLNESVPLREHSLEAHYLHAGTLMDVIGGPRFRHIPQEARQIVVQTAPRGRFKETMKTHVQRQQQLRPHSRMALLAKMGFAEMVSRAPFND